MQFVWEILIQNGWHWDISSISKPLKWNKKLGWSQTCLQCYTMDKTVVQYLHNFFSEPDRINKRTIRLVFKNSGKIVHISAILGTC